MTDEQSSLTMNQEQSDMHTTDVPWAMRPLPPLPPAADTSTNHPPSAPSPPPRPPREVRPSAPPIVVQSPPEVEEVRPTPSTSSQAHASPMATGSEALTSLQTMTTLMNSNNSGSSGGGRENEAFRTDEELDYTLAPPSYDEVINSTRFPIVRTGNRLSSGGENAGWRLDFVDFSPHVSGSGDRHVGDFKTLVKRANSWLKSNPDVELKTCETITWTATSQSALSYTDSVLRSKSLSASLKTRYLRGLRLWFVPCCDRVDRDLTINIEDIAPDNPSDTMETLVKKANKQFKYRPLSGTVLNMETVFTRTRRGKIYANSTFWAESPSKARQYTFFLRIFYSVGSPKREEIGIQDFLPEQRSDSYENFTQVTEKGCQWAASQSDTRITNMQAVFVKRKGTPQMSHGRCFYTEHALKTEHRVTYYYQLLRTYTAKAQSELSIIVQMPLQLTKKTFAPAMLPPTGDEREQKFESFTKTVERVSSWLDSTRAEVFCIETIPVRMNTGTQQRLGPEATLVWSQPEVGIKCEDWLLFVRVYVKGEYEELRVHHALSMPPVDWYRQPRHEPIRRPARRKRNCFVFCLVFLFLITTSFVIVYIFMNLLWKILV